MCEYSDRLIAWLDEVVPVEEAAVVEGHLVTCGTCRESLIAYRGVSVEIKAYCQAVTDGEVRRPVATWAFAASSVVAIAVAVVIWGGFSARARVKAWPDPAASVATVAIPQQSEPKDLEPLRPHHSAAYGSVAPERMGRAHRAETATTRAADLNWIPAEPSVEIVVPADTVFPPGVVPDGISFVADLSIGADGSATWLRWRR